MTRKVSTLQLTGAALEHYTCRALRTADFAPFDVILRMSTILQYKVGGVKLWHARIEGDDMPFANSPDLVEACSRALVLATFGDSVDAIEADPCEDLF